MTAFQDRIYRLGSWLEGLKSALSGENGFIHRGVIVRHPGMFLDQVAAAAAIDGAVSLVEAKTARGAAIALLPRVTVVLRPSGPVSVHVTATAYWAGGLFDRGTVLIRAAAGWPARLEEALAQLLLRELKADSNPGDPE